MTVIPNSAARRLFLARHGLAEPPRGRLDAAGLLALIQRLGFVQIDSVATVERAHHMILFARNGGYRPELLDRLLERDRTLFENWTHDASVIPTAFYPHWKPRFARRAAEIPERWKGWQGEAWLAEVAHVREHLRANGPAAAGALDAAPRGRPDGDGARGGAGGEGAGWWDWAPRKAALEYLWHAGEVAVARREGFRKIYDLAERVHPEAHAAPEPDPDAHLDWACAGALDRLGFATPGELAAFWALVPPEAAKAWVRANRAALEEVRIEAADGSLRPSLARPGLADLAAAAPEPPGRLRVLSPFDPVLRNRDRARRLFGFDYRIEIFVPAPRRRYGYYVFPLLEGDRFVGRIDMKAHRDEGALRVAALWPEPGVAFGKGRMARLEAELGRVARFAGCDRVAFGDGWLRS